MLALEEVQKLVVGRKLEEVEIVVGAKAFGEFRADHQEAYEAWQSEAVECQEEQAVEAQEDDAFGAYDVVAAAFAGRVVRPPIAGNKPGNRP